MGLIADLKQVKKGRYKRESCGLWQPKRQVPYPRQAAQPGQVVTYGNVARSFHFSRKSRNRFLCEILLGEGEPKILKM